MAEAISMLYEEHEVIITAAGLVDKAAALIENNPTEYEKAMRTLLHFFREYADGYHHRKEEELLFPEMERESELLAGGILAEMWENHRDFRQMLQEIEALLNSKEYKRVAQMAKQYTDSLLDHIAAENDEVFQSAQTLLHAGDLEKMGFRFEDCDRELGFEKKIELVKTIDNLGLHLNALQA